MEILDMEPKDEERLGDASRSAGTSCGIPNSCSAVEERRFSAA